MKHLKFNFKKGAGLAVPFLLFFAALICLSVWGAQALRNESAYSEYFSLLFRQNAEPALTIDDQAPQLIRAPETEDVEYLEGTFPMPNYGKQWATLNVSGFALRDIPVYYGNSVEILTKGAGQSQLSRFCGQNGKVVLSAHVNRHFFELEDAAARFDDGEEVLVTMDTLWGSYVYRVDRVLMFAYNDFSPLDAEDGAETIVIYTCYPRENAFSFKEQRIGLHATLVSGATWRDYAER